MTPAKRFYTSRKAAEVLGVHPRTVVNWARAKKIPARKNPGPNGQYKFPADYIDSLAAVDAEDTRDLAGVA